MTFAFGNKTLNVKKLILIGRVDTEDNKLPTMAATLYGEGTSLWHQTVVPKLQSDS